MLTKTLVLATHNKHKAQELTAILAGLPYRVKTLSEIGFSDEIVENGDSFEANAEIKARAVASKLRAGLILADDSGLEVDALNGAPGIYSARYAGEGATSAQLCQKLLKEMSHNANRSAQFTTAMAIIELPSANCKLFRGQVKGFICDSMVGEGGFGYDPVFFYPPFQKTMAEMTEVEKNSISHRYNALKAVIEYLKR